MQIVLLKKVKTLGNAGEIKDVKRGYAVNFLISSGLALPATQGYIKEVKNRTKKYDKVAVVDLSGMAELMKELEDLEVVMSAKANEKGNLFSSIHKVDIIEAIAKKISKSIDEDYIILKQPIKKIGDYEIEIKVSDEIKGKIKVKVEAEK